LHDLIPLDPALSALGRLSEAEVDATMAFAAAEKAASTREAYALDRRRSQFATRSKGHGEHAGRMGMRARGRQAPSAGLACKSCSFYVLRHGRQCLRPWAAGSDPGQSAP
jgi:hypothetical protein